MASLSSFFHHLTLFDAAVVVILVISAFSAFYRGFCKELFTLIAMIGAILISAHLSQYLVRPMESLISQPTLANAAAKITTFILAALVLGFIGKMMAQSMRQTISYPLDASLGVVFGVLRGALFIFIPFFFVELFFKPDAYPHWLAESESRKYLEEGTIYLKQYLPKEYLYDHKKMNEEETKETVQETKDKAEKKLDGYTPEERHKMDGLVKDKTK